MAAQQIKKTQDSRLKNLIGLFNAQIPAPVPHKISLGTTTKITAYALFRSKKNSNQDLDTEKEIGVKLTHLDVQPSTDCHSSPAHAQKLDTLVHSFQRYWSATVQYNTPEEATAASSHWHSVLLKKKHWKHLKETLIYCLEAVAR